MTMTRWDPFRELETMSSRLNQLFGRPGPLADMPRDALAVSDWSPAVDVAETAEEYLVKVDLPEVRKEDVKVSIDQGTLRITGERRHEKDDKTKHYHRVERFRGSFVRSFGVPSTVDQTKLTAEMKDGSLTVRLPKSSPSKPTSTEVKIA